MLQYGDIGYRNADLIGELGKKRNLGVGPAILTILKSAEQTAYL